MFSDLRTLILSDSTISGLISDRLQFPPLKQGEVYPAVTYRRISSLLSNTHNSAGAVLRRTRVQFEFLARHTTECEALENAFIGLLNEYSGTVGATKFHRIDWESELDDEELETKIYSWTGDAIVWHSPA